MNGKDIFLGMKYIGEDLIEEAEYGSFTTVASRNEEMKTPRWTSRRLLLVVALIVLMLLLVGCAVVYVIKMHDLVLTEEPGEMAIYSPDGNRVVGYEEVNQQILTLDGLKGTPGYQAAQEWYLFRQNYDPDVTILIDLLEQDQVPEYPAEYSSFVLYTQEMKDTLDSILEKYGLTTPGSLLEFRTVQNMCSALGIEKFQAHYNNVAMKVRSGYCYSGGNFGVTLDFELPAESEVSPTLTWGNLYWHRKECLSSDHVRIDDTGDWKEWNYTTASGDEVLIIRSPSDWRGLILCDRGEALLSLQLDVRIESPAEGVKDLWLSDRQMELVADAIDFGIQPRKVSQEDVDNQPSPPNSATQDGYTVELKGVQTDGYVLRMLLGITAPEGTDISTSFQENGDYEKAYNIAPSNDDYLIPIIGEFNWGTYDRYPQEDGDGLANTQDFLYMILSDKHDGSAPFAPGTTWNLHFEDLVHRYWDEKNSTNVEEVLAEGEWNFEIALTEENGDYREIEFIQEPVTIQANVLNKGLVWTREEVQVTTFKLRTFSACIESDQERIVDFTYLEDGKGTKVVMKDGSCISLNGAEGLYEVSIYPDFMPIDLEQVDYIQMADGTKLQAP